jgi:hypothetical protein
MNIIILYYRIKISLCADPVGSGKKNNNLLAAAQCEIHIQQKFFPNAVQLEFNGQKLL